MSSGPLSSASAGGAAFKPYVPASSTMAEFSVQVWVLGIILNLVMCSANIYVGLYAGMTVSAAIPASVISMGILRGILKRGTILENNIVHSIASSGESLAAGIIFTVPALVLLGAWDHFNYMETTLIAMTGGVLGVIMMIPLRRALIVENKELRFPEGVACAEVLKAGDKGGEDLFGIFWAILAGGAFKICVSVLGIFKETVSGAVRIGKTVFGAGTDISPMLMAVGFIVGWDISLLVVMGGAMAWFIAIPVLIPIVDGIIADPAAHAFAAKWVGTLPTDLAAEYIKMAPADMAEFIWNKYIRFLGVGMMVVGGIWSIIQVRNGIKMGIKYAIEGLRGGVAGVEEIRTEQNIKGKQMGLLILACVAMIAVVYYIMTGHIVTTIVTTVLMFVLSFFFVAVAAYIVGLVGSSNSPVSGMTICTVLVTAGVLIVMGYTGTAGIIATLGVAGVVCSAACLSGDICQDLKISYILGGTPRRQQWAQVVGSIIPAFIIAPVMTLLHRAYGIGVAVRPGVEPLKAPQAKLFASLVEALIGGKTSLPWGLVIAGLILGAGIVAINKLILEPKNTKFRLYIMPLAVGIYLPLSVSMPMLIGGLVMWYVEKRTVPQGEEVRAKAFHRGTLFSSGLVAGEAIMGVLIAGLLFMKIDVPFAATAFAGKIGLPADILSLAALGAMVVFLTRYSMKKKA